jgi:hypothetical protein
LLKNYSGNTKRILCKLGKDLETNYYLDSCDLFRTIENLYLEYNSQSPTISSLQSETRLSKQPIYFAIAFVLIPQKKNQKLRLRWLLTYQMAGH